MKKMQEVDGQPQRAELEDLDLVLQLLDKVDLPTEGVRENFHNFIVWHGPNKLGIKGCIGLEVYETDAVLRSVAVYPDQQGEGVGTKLLEAVIDYARGVGVDTLYLLTDTAESYFQKHGFTLIDRSRVPKRISESIEFTTLCPSSPCLFMAIA
jgi:amino-acid N-acetyltransferase